MVDVLFLTELAWCVVWWGTRPPIWALLSSAGIVVSTLTASQVSGWLTRLLAPPTSTVFLWIEHQIDDTAQAVTNLRPFLPAQPTLAVTTAGLHQWIAYSILKSMILLLITGAVYWLFLLMIWLAEALWDIPWRRRSPGSYRAASVAYGLCAGLFVCGLTGYGLVHVAWLRSFTGLSALSSHSLGIYALEHWINWLRLHPSG